MALKATGKRGTLGPDGPLGMPLTVSLICGLAGAVETALLTWAAASGGVALQFAFTLLAMMPIPPLGLVIAAAAAADRDQAGGKAQYLALALNFVSTLFLPMVFFIRGHVG